MRSLTLGLQRWGPLALLLLAGFLVGKIGADAAAAELHTVVQKGRNFAVRHIAIARGESVEFTNDDDFLHQIYINSPTLHFDSAEQAPGQSLDVLFGNRGTYDVRCRIHPKMLMTVTVK